MFGTNLTHVTPQTRLISPIDCDRIEASIDYDLQPCTRDQGSTLVAELLAAYPGVVASKDGSSESYREFQLYAIKLCEAFVTFSFAIGKAIVHGGTGVPSLVQFKPQPSDIVKFGMAEKDKRLNVKTMAQRHREEAKRREREAEDEKKYDDGDADGRKQRVADLIRGFKANAIDHPVPLKTPSGHLYVEEPKVSTLDMDRLIASHDAAMAGAHRKNRAA